MDFDIHLSKRTEKFLKTCNDELYNRILQKLKKLESDPFPHDVKRVFGQKEKTFRVRVGDYRLLYVVFLDDNVILVVNIDKRPRAY